MSSTTLRITLLASEWNSSKGGLSTMNRELAIQLARHPNVSVAFFVPKCTEDDKKQANSRNITIVEARERPGFDPIDWLSFPPRDLVIDIIIGHGVKLGKQAQVIMDSHHCKWMQVVHTVPEELAMFKTYSDAISKGDEKQWTEVKLCKIADLVVAVGSKLCEVYSRYLSSSGKTVFNLTPSIFTELSNLKPSTEGSKKFWVLVFGRGDSEDFELKGFDIAAKAVAKLNDRSYHLIFVGAPSGNETQVAEKLLEQGLHRSQLTVKGYLENRDDLATLLSTANLAIIPSRTEGFGLTALEALSAGLPFLVSQNSGFGEALHEIPSGSSWIVDSEDPEQWAKAIKAVREKGQETALKECQELRTRYAEKYSWEEQCNALVERMLTLVRDYTARAQSQQKAREEIVKRMKDEMEHDRQEALREVQERTRMEDDEQRRNLDRQRHEKQRKGKEEEKLLQLKDELMNYDFHRCPRIKKEYFKDLDVDDIDSIRIVLFGPTGSGKTSFVGTLQRAIGREQTAVEEATGREGTLYLEEYYIQKKICMVDTRGFFESDQGLMDECRNIMSGRIRPGEKIVRIYDKEGNQEPNTAERKAPALSKYAHAVIFVVKANNSRLKDGKYEDKLQKIREHFKEDGIVPVTVITYLDRLQDKEEKDEVFDQASRATGSSSERTYFIANYVHRNAEQSFLVDQTALDILDSALLSAERFIRIHKQREKNQMEREAMAGAANKGMESVKQFFFRLQKKYNWTDQGKKKAVLADLRKMEINTVKVLQELWEGIKSDLPLSPGMMIALEEEMKHI